MKVIPDVDGYTKTLNHQKVLRKKQKHYWKPKKY